jgi:serine/threonine protein kinase
MFNLFHSSSDFLQPFEVLTDCRGGITVTAVYCKCIDGGAPSLVNKHLFKTPFPQVQGCQGDLSYKFWTIRLKQPKPDASSPPPQPKYGTSRNTLVTGDIVKLIGNSLPMGLCSTRTYCVLNHTDKGFDLSSVLQPALPPPSSAQSHPPPHALSMNAPKVDQRISILRPETFPLGLFCDAASRYHTLEQSSELSQRWKGIIVRKMTTDFGEFAKCFCSKVLREEHQTVRIFETDHSPELLCNMIQFCKAFQCEVFASMYSIPLEKSPCAELHSIHEASMSFKKIRNKICHGDFHTLCEADFETLTKSSRTILEGVLRLSAIMKAQPNVSSDIAASFESIKLAATKILDEIFGSDQSRHCILSRHMASNILTPDENADMKLMLKNFDLERQQLKAQNQSLALQNEDLNAQLEARDQLRFSNLPIVVLEKDLIIRDQIDQQRSENKGKHGGQAVVYQIEFRDEFREEVLMAKIFNSTKDGAWRRELNALNALSDEFIVRVRYVIYATYHEKNRLEPIGYAMEAMACSLQDFAQQNTFQDSSEKYLMLLRQVAKALRFAHSRRFAHLDVNPRNILLDDALNPTVAKLCDFGCAHFMQTRASRLEARGSEYFTAPEFQPGSPAEVDPFPMDIYAFGVVIFTLLHPNATHLELSSCHDPVIWDKVDICPEFPVISQFRDLGCSCTNRDPRKRPSIQDVTNILGGLNVEGIAVSDPAVVLHLKGMSDGAPAFVEDSSQQAFSFQEAEPLLLRQSGPGSTFRFNLPLSAKAQCAFCLEDFSVSMMYVRMCERQDPSSAHGGAAVGGGAAAGLAEACRICYSCLFDGLFTQFKDCQLPQCIVCKTPMHQTAFNECMSILGANFSDKLGGNNLNHQVCTCGFLEKALWKGSAAQNPESIKKHTKECSFAIIKRMKNQADDIILQSALAGNEFMVACPGAGCKSYVEVAVMENPQTRKLVKVRECVRCLSCRTSFCPKCGATPYHFNTQCEEIATLRREYTEWMTRGRQAFLRQRAEMDASCRKQLQDYEADKARVEAEKRQLEVVAQQAAADEAYKAQNCKMCPSCGRIVQKTGGCDDLVCGQDYHGGNKQQGCGHSFSWPSAPAYRAQDVQPRQIQFNMQQPQQMYHKWLLCPGQDQNCDACAGPIVGPKFTCINCESLTICATCESLGPQALQGKLNKAHFGAHETSHAFMVEMPPDM